MHREAQAWAPKKKRLPVTLVTGFLGAGKTTLLTYILSNKHNLKIAAAVNDFASLNIDSQIVQGAIGHKEGVVELSNGCLCCSVSGEFRKAVWALLQDADIGKIDYLLVETSGVTDPLQTIATLEQEYGEMYRVQLDVVVTVVDADNILQKDDMNQTIAATNQLMCADVILLNKRDLVTEEQLERVKEYISMKVPGATIYSCIHGAIPLNWIMEVSEVISGPKVVSHEVTPVAYTVGFEGGGVAKNVSRRQRIAGIHNVSNHLTIDAFQSLVFVSSAPFRLTSFQHFLSDGFPIGIVRMKGTVWFQENHSSLYTFHMSGRNRYELTPTQSMGGAFKVELVAIGTGDQSLIQRMLEECVYINDLPLPGEVQRYKTICQLIKSHNYFILEEQDNLSYVDFRVTGCIDYGVTEEEANGFHGINFNRMNNEVASRVNGSYLKESVLPVRLANGIQVCRHSTGAEFEDTWKSIVMVAVKVVSEYYQAVGVCKCGR